MRWNIDKIDIIDSLRNNMHTANGLKNSMHIIGGMSSSIFSSILMDIDTGNEVLVIKI